MLKHRTALKFGLDTEFSIILYFNLKNKTKSNKQSKQIQNLGNNNNTRASVLSQYTPKIKYPSSTQGSKYMTASPINREVKVNQHRQSHFPNVAASRTDNSSRDNRKGQSSQNEWQLQ